MQKFDHRNIIYEIIGTKERVLVRQGKRAIGVRAIKVLQYIWSSVIRHRFDQSNSYRIFIIFK